MAAKKRTPGKSVVPWGCYRLLPQLVGSFDPGGRVGGTGMPPRIGLFNVRYA
jgi:hypothetical protein